jgi:DNA-binding HxlR family transcriptional regulator
VRGGPVTPVWSCVACGQSVTEKDVLAQWGPSGGWPQSMPVESTRRRSSTDRVDGRVGQFPQAMSILGNRWGFALIVAAFVGTSRFGDFQDQLGAQPGSLADRLQIFVANGVLTAGAGSYQLTEKGRAVFPILITALQWAQRCFHAPEGPAVQLAHANCGQRFDAMLTCDQCAGALRGTEISLKKV